MSLARLQSLSLLGLEAVPVEIEVDALPSEEKQTFVIVGLPDTAIRESKDRVLASVRNSGFGLNYLYITVNLAPADLRKEGALYDLPIALGLLLSLGKIETSVSLNDYLLVGELGLSGQTRPIQGALAMAILARGLKKRGLLLPAANALEAAAVPGIDVIAISNLREAVQFLKQPSSITPVTRNGEKSLFKPASAQIDFTDIKGQAHAKRAMEVAAAGGHNLVLSGPPGSGKTMLAKALAGIMPLLTIEEALETTKIHSIAGTLRDGESLITQRPFRSPHHTVSYAGLIGGGTIPRPGEVSLAHNGILFLDELPEFPRAVLEVLRQPLEDRKVTISRAQGNFTYPTHFICVAAMNPCPCGFLGHPDKMCSDTPKQVDRYRGKISGPLWDRFDMHVDVPALRYSDLVQAQPGESSETIRARVEAARQLQRERYGKAKANAQLSAAELSAYCRLDSSCQELMQHVIDVMGLSARLFSRLTKVARTIADLDRHPHITRDHLMEAINFRKQSS